MRGSRRGSVASRFHQASGGAGSIVGFCTTLWVGDENVRGGISRMVRRCGGW